MFGPGVSSTASTTKLKDSSMSNEGNELAENDVLSSFRTQKGGFDHRVAAVTQSAAGLLRRGGRRTRAEASMAHETADRRLSQQVARHSSEDPLSEAAVSIGSADD
jgi:hypothetical protein